MSIEENAGSILIVDDDPQVCESLSDVFKTVSQYHVRTAPSGARALQIMDDADFDLIITDLKMSGMGGLALIAKIKELPPPIPAVVILSGYGDMDMVIAAMRAGVDDYIKKPYSTDELMKVVDREVKRSRSRVGSAAPTTDTDDQPVASAVDAQSTFNFSESDLHKIETALSQLRAQTNADSVLLIEDDGYVVAAKGVVDDTDLQSLAMSIIGARSISDDLAELLDAEGGFAIIYLEGEKTTVYSVAVSRELDLVLVVPRDTRQGSVRLYVREATAEIAPIAQEVAPPEAAASSQEQQAETSQTRDTPIEETAPEPQTKAAPEPEPVNWDEEEDQGETVTMSFEEARKQGLLGDIDWGDGD